MRWPRSSTSLPPSGSLSWILPAVVRAQHDGAGRPLAPVVRKDAVVEIDGDHLLFLSDYLFKSLSTAASVVLGRSANGRTEWKDANGRTVAEIESEAIEQGAQKT
jgi:hypothetical protein